MGRKEFEYINVRHHTKQTIQDIADLLDKKQYEVADLAVASLLEDSTEELADKYRTNYEIEELRELLEQGDNE